MAKIGENAIANAIKRGVEEVHSFVTGKPVQEVVEPAKAEPPKQEMSYEHGLSEAARAPRPDKARGMER